MVSKRRLLFIVGICWGTLSYATPVNSAIGDCTDKAQIDLERDGKLDCVDIRPSGNYTILRVRLSSSGQWVELARYVASDEVLSVVPLAKYDNPRFTAPRKGCAIRLTFPEKSSVLYYWDMKSSAMIEYWESD
jgi:hypothetical protein